ncbi:MAG: hypothetical protein KatS3mg018_0588 [Fimbriimonadales bacterium]|nr:MAG: hypothetical protein KatS3mg018_0588 [Fimbriimonadales bacterium]
MRTLTVRRHKLREAIRKYPRLVEDLVEARKQGVSYSELAFMVYDLTGIRVTPYAVREWMLELEAESKI